MLSKVNKDNWEKFGTPNIINYCKNNLDFKLIQDNLESQLLIKNSKNQVFIFDYKLKKYFYQIKNIKLNILNKYFWKNIDSFDQNNIKIANPIRKYVLTQLANHNHTKTNILLGIGGEYYVYFPFVQYKQYIGLSNHDSIVTDANYNLEHYLTNDCYHNYLVNYNNLNTFPQINLKENYDIVINVSNLHFNHIEYIKNININKLVIITCTPIYKKIPQITKYFKIIKLKYFINVNSIVYIITCIKNKINQSNWISLGSNCSITHQLNQYGLRINSYPFDWAKISLNQLINVLTNNFDSYTNLSVEKLSNLHLTINNEESLLIKNFYSIKFAHELTKQIELEKFKNKLIKRIKNFNNLIGKKVKFIRIELNKINTNYFKQIDCLIELLDKFSNNYELILILNCNCEINYSNVKVKIYNYKDFSPDWKMDLLDWKQIFNL